MKSYAYKDIASNEIRILHCNGDAEEIMKMASPDNKTGAGTEADPYIYTATATLMGELDKDDNGKYIFPSRVFRASWRDVSGQPAVDMSLARAEKMGEFRVERDKRLVKSDADWVEITSKGEVITATETYKTELRDMMSSEQTSVDAETDIDVLVTYDATWPTDPNA